ncbi:lysophospholipid acyltransferase family protein [Rubellimicrobium sp. CFH 75288]|uniref:lysophospholipid acyltransferase family protein n=1 Tax=Rubellimicrobium sp. CFH 75288 TaxID=2697034 RepID=UPI0014120371|nr:lysophospholipid acyltransferase family protein [Rubellimicrobium sp. CFH 75288]NAZ37637.1 acyltransferase [Rubellimicrobium sp. CFH 75288]
MPPSDDPVALRSAPVAAFFARIMTHQMRGAFRAVRLLRPGLPDLPAGRPLVVVANHPSWWDPAFFIVLHARLFAAREGYGPMEAAMLARYGFFRRIGTFGVPDGRAGAAAFLRIGEHVLASPRRMLWVPAQGRFADPRERPLGLRPGAAHLLARVPEAVALPLALEYPFWTERRPEALAAFGTPLVEQDDARGWARRLEEAATAAADRLAEAAIARDPALFVTLLGGRRGPGGVWGGWERLRAAWRGERHRPDHRPEEP